MKHIFYNSQEKRVRSGWRILIFLLIGLSLTLIYNTLAVQWMPAFYQSSLSSLFTNLSFIYALHVCVKYIAKQDYADFGFQMDQEWSTDFFAGFFMGFLMISTVFLIGYSLHMFKVIGYNYSIYSEPFTYALFGQFFRYLNTGIFEETIFRSFMMITIAQGIKNSRLNWQQSIWTTATLTGLFFGIAHLGNPHANLFGTLNIIIVGVLLSMTYIFTGRVAIAIGIHITWNFGQSNLFGLATSGGAAEVSLLEVQVSGSEWVTGSAFGPEAGLLGTIGFLIMIPLMILYIKKQYGSLHFRLRET